MTADNERAPLDPFELLIYSLLLDMRVAKRKHLSYAKAHAEARKRFNRELRERALAAPLPEAPATGLSK